MSTKKTTSSSPETTAAEAPKAHRPWWRHWWLPVVVVVVLLIGGAVGYGLYSRGRIMPRTIIGGVAVGGLTEAQAKTVLAAHENTFAQAPLTLSYQSKTWTIKPVDIGVTFQTDSAVALAYQIGRGPTLIEKVGGRLKALVAPRRIILDVAPFNAQGTTQLQTLALNQIQTPPVETTLSFVPGKVAVVPGKNGDLLDTDQFNRDLASAFASHTSRITLVLATVSPTVAANQATSAIAQANAILAAPWTLHFSNQDTKLTPTTVAGWLTTQPQNGQLQVSVEQTKLSSYLAALSTHQDKAPINATLTVTNGVVTIAKDGTPGLGLDATQTAAAISTALLTANPTNRTINGVNGPTNPKVWSGNFATLGLNQLIGTGTTDFSGSPANRIENITTGVNAINSGQVIAPGATFSTIADLGPIDAAHGYVSALVILGNQTVPADGGGLCQVSTTLFRAVLNAGLPVTARSPHAYEVSYYQRGVGPGLDATIYDPSPDFRWVNDTGHYVFVQGVIDDKKLTFNLYGTSDGRTVTLDGPHTLSTTQPSGDPIYVNTNTLPAGKTELIDPPVPGATTMATYTVTRNGQVIHKQVFNSTYRAMPAQYLVGTG